MLESIWVKRPKRASSATCRRSGTVQGLRTDLPRLLPPLHPWAGLSGLGVQPLPSPRWDRSNSRLPPPASLKLILCVMDMQTCHQTKDEPPVAC